MKIAENEYRKISTNRKYRSPEKTRLKFTERNMALNLDNKIPVGLYDFTRKAIQMIRAKYQG